MLITVDAHTVPTDLVGKPAQYGHMIGRFTDLRHLDINPTGKSRTGLEPGMVGSFNEQPSPACRGGNTAVYVQYGDTIDIQENQ